MATVEHQSQGIFDISGQSADSLLPLQVITSDPTLPTLRSASGLLTPDVATATRMAHFPEDLYDLRDQSHLVRFFRALVGDSGAGQLRKRYTVARLQTTLSSTHFYDLDGFYGSLFGAHRKVEEQLPINPMDATALPDEWDDIATRDSRYRERINALAKALPMAGTVPGLQQAAEALTGVECDVYETWRIIEGGGVAAVGRTWDQVETDFIAWSSFDEQDTWDSVNGAEHVGRAGLDNLDEVYIRPKKDYTPVDGSDEAAREAARQRLEDEVGLHQVLSRLKPAGVLLTIDSDGLALHTVVPIAGAVADSNFWQVVTKTTPKPSLVGNANHEIYPVSPVKASLGVVADGVLDPLPVPPFTTGQGHQWSYNASINSTKGYAIKEPGSTVSGTGTVVDTKNWEKVLVSTVSSAKSVEYPPGKAPSDQRALLAAQASADSMLMAHPYSGPRVAVGTHG